MNEKLKSSIRKSREAKLQRAQYKEKILEDQIKNTAQEGTDVPAPAVLSGSHFN